MDKVRNFTNRIFIFMVFILFLNSMYPWYVFDNKFNLICIALTAVVSAFLLLTGRNLAGEIRKNKTLIILLTLFVLYMCIKSNINGVVNWMALYFVYLSIIASEQKTKEEMLKFITKWMAILVTVSLVFYLLWMFRFIHLSPKIILFDDIGAYKRYNYYLFMVGDDGRLANYYRFAAIFLEPGHMTMGAVPLIALNRFRFSNLYVLLLSIGVLLSFSLAGIITIVIGYAMLNFNRKLLISLLGAVVVFGGLTYAIYSSGYGKVLEVFLYERLEFKDGKLAGYNRTTAKFDKRFEKILNTTEVLTGSPSLDKNREEFGNAGYKLYIVQYGVIGLILAIMLYMYYMFAERRYIVTAVTIIYLLLLFQNSYPAWVCVLGSYLFGMPCLKSDSLAPAPKKEENKKPVLNFIRKR